MIIVNAVFVVVSYIGHRHKKREHAEIASEGRATGRRSSNVLRLPTRGARSDAGFYWKNVAGLRVATAKLG